MTFGEKLKQLRKSKGYSQEQLAKMLHMGRSAISMYESDQREPNFETLEAIADIFNVDMDTLASSKQNDKQNYYMDEETAKLAQALHDDPNLRTLLDASRKLKPEELQTVINLIKTMKGIE